MPNYELNSSARAAPESEQDQPGIESVKHDFERLWHAGEQPTIEEVVRSVPDSMHAALLRELLPLEVHLRRAAGLPHPSPAEYSARFPAHAALVADLFAPTSASTGGAAGSAPHEKPRAETVATGRTLPLSGEPEPVKHRVPDKPTLPRQTIPETFGRYRIVRELGRGGMGTVYLAHDQQLDRNVALKIPFFRDDDDVDAVERFYREARAMAMVQHANLCPVYDVGRFEHWHFLTMAYIDGQPLSRKIKAGGGLALIQAVTMLRTVATAVQKAHEAGIVHRDLKPSNIMLTADLEPIIMDFGLARRRKAGEAELTQSNAILGSPAYMAPEQVEARHEEVGPATDVYALGVILYQMVTGRRPFEGSVASIFGQIVSRMPDPPTKLCRDLPAAIDAICLKAIAKAPSQRHATAGEFAADLASLLSEFNEESRTVSYLKSPSFALRSESDSDVASSSRSRRDAELRQVTVAIFSYEPDDSSINASSSSHSEQLHEQSQSFASLVADQVTRLGGASVVGSGQEVLACFGFPQAFEDAPQRAVRVALQVMRELAAHRHSHLGLPLASQAWVVLHSGEAVAEEIAGSQGTSISLVGDARNTATRLNAIADPGTIAISAATHQRVALFFECESLGSQRVRGMSQPVELFRVVKEAASRNRVDLLDPGNMTPLVGRDTELTILKDRWEQALDELGQIVLLIGDAGLGKSRLIRELREHVIREDREQAAVIEWRCSQYHQNTSFYPVVEYFARLLDFERASPAERLESLLRYLAELHLDSPADVALFCGLLEVPTDERVPALALSPQKVKERTAALLLQWLKQLVKVRPVLFIVEDLHWLDPSTLELLEKFVSEFSSGRLLSMFTFRPEFETPWKSKPQQTQIALNRLTKRQIGEMMRKRTKRRDIPDAILQQVIERTDGIPLFIEEFTVVIEESGILDRSAAGADVASLLSVIPATLHDLLLARLDRMAADREVIQLAATIGREFGFRLLSSSCVLPADALRHELDKLVKAEILFHSGQAAEATYIFKHALLQDAAYRSMLTKKRQACHQRIAEVLETQFTDVVTSQPALLAHHFTEAGDTDKAIQYWLKAGRKAQEQSANVEAIRHFERGIALTMTLPGSPQRDLLELSLKLPLSGVLMGAKGYSAPEVAPLHDRCIELCRRMGEGSPLFPVLIGKWGWNFIASRFEECDVRCAEVIAIADQKNLPGMKAEAHWARECTSFFAGDFATARKHAELGLAHYDRAASIEFIKITQQGCGPLMLAFLGQALWKLGYPDQGLARMHDAIAMCLDLKHPFTQTVIEWQFGQYYDFARLGEQALAQGRKTCALADELVAPFYSGLGLGCQADGLRHLGRHAEAIPLLERCLASTKMVGARCTLGKYAGSLAESLWQVGRREEAWKMLDEAFEYISSGERHMEAELFRYRGDFHHDLGDLSQAEAAYRKSLAVAVRQQAKSYELRTTMRLGRLWVRQGHVRQARAELVAIYDWFTEGCGTPDLVEARGLLSEWRDD